MGIMLSNFEKGKKNSVMKKHTVCLLQVALDLRYDLNYVAYNCIFPVIGVSLYTKMDIKLDI